MLRNSSMADGGKSLRSDNGSSHKAIKYSTSIRTRYWINPNSEKYGLRDFVFGRYRPSTGEIALNLFNNIGFQNAKVSNLAFLAIENFILFITVADGLQDL